MPKYVVTINKQFYPSVYYFDSLTDAIEKYADLLQDAIEALDEAPEGCNDESTIALSIIMESKDVKLIGG